MNEGERMHGENSESGSQRVKSSHTMVIYGPFHADLRDCNPSDDPGHPWEAPWLGRQRQAAAEDCRSRGHRARLMQSELRACSASDAAATAAWREREATISRDHRGGCAFEAVGLILHLPLDSTTVYY